jgi:metal-responsive CopG/Arc/MetJ family transcriptional regulator
MSLNRTTRVIGFSVPPTLANEVEAMAKVERRTKSELFREMVRVYQRYRLQRDHDEQRWVANLIQEANAEQARDPMTPAHLRAEDERLVKYGAAQARKLRIKPKDVNRLIHEYRQGRKA